MKKYIIYALLVVLLVGCSEDFLDLTPPSNLTADQFYQTEADYETAIAGVYYQWAEMTVRPLYQAEYRSDNIKYWRLLYNEFSSNNFGPSSTEVIWGNFYRNVIQPSNRIINTIDDIEMDAATKNRIKGEALFFRGYSYYWMNMWFEGVPLVLNTLTIEESFQLGRATEAAIWTQAESDLSAAYGLLPATESEYGRVNKYAAEMFLARTYMQQQKWGAAETALADIFNNSGAELDTDWAGMWSAAGQASSKENMLVSIWNEVNSDDDMSQMIRCIDCPNTGAGYIEYEPGLMESFEAGDIRLDETLGFVGGEFLNKKWDFGLIAGGYWVGDFVVIRFTDVQLLYAEAISMNAGSAQQESLDLINETRNRAGLTNDIVLADVPALDDFVEAVLAERRAEFIFESQRYADLKRHNKLVSKLNAIGYDFDDNFNRIPVPSNEIDKMNGILVQNPGYEGL